MLFKETKLKQGILKWLEETWYNEATPIQEQVISLALDWKNIVWQSQTWTWKTAAFLLPLINNIDTNRKETQALILAPTRELVIQIADEIHKLTKYYRVITTVLYWWVSSHNQKVSLKRRPRIIVATPWRFMDLLWQRLIFLPTIETFVLDEVDRMLDMWFVRDIIKIRKQLTNIKQTFTFSATMTDDIRSIIDKYTGKYEFIKVWEEITVDKIDHSYTVVENRDKIMNLTKIINTHKNDKILIFANRKRTTKLLFETLEKEWYKLWILNWDVKQSKRISTLEWYKKGKFKILVTTDVAARWLNMDNVWLVINFDMPIEVESYIHRIWRTWRAWANGKAIMFVWQNEKKTLRAIENVCEWKIKLSDYQGVLDTQWTYKQLPTSFWRYQWGGGWRSGWWWGWRSGWEWRARSWWWWPRSGAWARVWARPGARSRARTDWEWRYQWSEWGKFGTKPNSNRWNYSSKNRG